MITHVLTNGNAILELEVSESSQFVEVIWGDGSKRCYTINSITI